jgi:chemotaxis protein MotB
MKTLHMPLSAILLSTTLLLMASCVSTKKYSSLQRQYAELKEQYAAQGDRIASCESEKSELNQQNRLKENELRNLQQQMDFLKENNTQMLRRLQDLSVLSGTQAESVRKSLENLGERDAYIRALQSSLSYKDSLMMVLVLNLKGALSDINDQDIEIKIEKGVVYISISDRMLFKSGSYHVNESAKTVLGKVAKVLSSKPDIEFMVEGHTDTVPISNTCMVDNWDLSVKRATSVIRILQEEYQMDPKRMTAAGRGEFLPIASNDTQEGRMTNRRTRIVIQPQFDQFFQLLERKQ